MTRTSLGTCALALALSPAFWGLTGAAPAAAHPSGDPDCYTAPFTDLISPCVPHDVPAGSSATIAELATFAWQEFIALNWVAMDPASTGVRGRPVAPTDPTSGFLGVEPDANGNYPLVVWQSYRHKNELFPYGKSADTSFDSPQPTYTYKVQPTPATGGAVPSFNLFNNLDETSQIGLANMYAHADSEVEPPSTPNILIPPSGIITGTPGQASGIRVAYEAKVNRSVYQYLVANNYTVLGTDPNNKYPALQTARQNTAGYDNNGLPLLTTYGGICSSTSTQPLVILPCGDIDVAGDAGEGAIEIKAAWRQLTPDEQKSGRFFTRNVIFYTGPQGSQKYNNAVWGLVALHIIHKTKSFPAFVFATWEQVDNYDDAATGSENPNPQTLAFQNLPLADDGTTSVQNIAVRRAHAIHPDVAATNDTVHAAFTAAEPDTVWQYYKLVGVQATPVTGPLPATAPANDLSYYYLANIMVETNQALQNFFGKVGDNGSPKLFENVYVNGAQGSPFTMGGCQGCHGFQGQTGGGDMSVLVAQAGANAQLPESLDSSPVESTRTVIRRGSGILRGDGHSLQEFNASLNPRAPRKKAH